MRELTETERVILWLAMEGACGIWEATWDLTSQGLVDEGGAIRRAMADTKTLYDLGLVEVLSQQNVTDDETPVGPADALRILTDPLNWTPPAGHESRPMYLLAATDAGVSTGLGTRPAHPAQPELRVAPDYQCYPLWLSDASGLDNPDPASLGLPPDLCERLLRWSDVFDATLDQDDPVRSGFPGTDAENAFVREGRALAAEVARAWGDRGPVTYYNVTTLEDEPVTGVREQ